MSAKKQAEPYTDALVEAEAKRLWFIHERAHDLSQGSPSVHVPSWPPTDEDGIDADEQSAYMTMAREVLATLAQERERREEAYRERDGCCDDYQREAARATTAEQSAAGLAAELARVRGADVDVDDLALAIVSSELVQLYGIENVDLAKYHAKGIARVYAALSQTKEPTPGKDAATDPACMTPGGGSASLSGGGAVCAAKAREDEGSSCGDEADKSSAGVPPPNFSHRSDAEVEAMRDAVAARCGGVRRMTFDEADTMLWCALVAIGKMDYSYPPPTSPSPDDEAGRCGTCGEPLRAFRWEPGVRIHINERWAERCGHGGVVISDDGCEISIAADDGSTLWANHASLTAHTNPDKENDDAGA